MPSAICPIYNLHNTAEILEAFQGCRDAGEEIDLFEALA